MKSYVLGLLAVALLAGPVGASATTTTYLDNKAGFLAATGATSIGSLPSFGTGNATGTVVGVVTFTNAFGNGSVAFFNFSNEIAGNDLGLSGLENFNMAIAGGAYAFGFDVHEPTYFGTNDTSHTGTWGCNAPCFDTTFSIEIFSGATSLGVFQYNPPDDSSTQATGPLGFFGVFSSVLFDRVQVRDLTDTIDNEMFGNFLVGSTAREVPEPGALALFGLGLAGLGVSRRRQTD